MNAEKRSYFRKNVHLLGSIAGNDVETHFACQNLSVGGMAIRINDSAQILENTVLTIRLPSLNLQATVWVHWREPLGNRVALIGVKFLRVSPIRDHSLPVVPKPYEPYEVKEELRQALDGIQRSHAVHAN